MPVVVNSEDKRVVRLSLHSSLATAERRDVRLFVLLYLTAASLALLGSGGFDTAGLVALPVLAFLHALTWLSMQWSVQVRCWLTFRSVGTLAEAEVVHVVPAALCGAPALCALQKSGAGAAEAEAVHFFVFQCLQYTCSGSAGDESGGLRFDPPRFPVDGEFRSYARAGGLADDTATAAARQQWGRNEFAIPMPLFMDLFKEHAVAPFFVFQMFCVLLWCLDEYWFYSVLTLVMLLVFESTVVKQRLRNLDTLRAMRRPPYAVHAFRSGKWQQLSSEDLLPGDLVSVSRPRHTVFPPGVSCSDEEVLFPCDALLLRGSVIVNEAMLTGESVPQQKSGISSLPTSSMDEALAMVAGGGACHGRHIIYGGTKVVLASPEQNGGLGADTAVASAVPLPPNGGCVAYVLRTGFGTSQGELMRTILFSTEQVTAHNKETGMFIAVLLVFAIGAAGFVLQHGLADEKRSRYKLMLHCIMIVTSVVPPELPMELSLAVNNSLLALSKRAIFCTEPYRIPFAGRVTTCCFDKTGTLTADNLVMQGVATCRPVADGEAGADAPKRKLCEPDELDIDTAYVLAGCQSLMCIDEKFTGDPAEMAAIKALGWSLGHNGGAVPPSGSKASRLRICLTYPFSSAVKRMSTIVALSGGKVAVAPGSQLRLLSKGAPEVMRALFKECPDDYDATYLRFTARGCRVLALGWRPLGGDSAAEERKACSLGRTEAEANLLFVGFLVLQCPLKRESKRCVKQLLASNHRVVMITGDNALTAHDVAHQVGIAGRSRGDGLFLQVSGAKGSGTLAWVGAKVAAQGSTDSAQPFDQGKIKALAQDHDLIVTGDALAELGGSSGKVLTPADMGKWVALCPHVSVFARTSPSQKEMVVAALKASGETTLMCGDGTNDVGALKQADVGISILNSPHLEQMEQSIHEHKKLMKDAKPALPASEGATALRRRRPGKHTESAHAVAAPTQRSSAKEQLRRQLEELEDQCTVVQLGDASIASPFTSKSPSISAVIHLVRQGRCTLVTTLQMFKILALNCLVQAYMLSFLYLRCGVRSGPRPSLQPAAARDELTADSCPLLLL